ncbi:MAG: nucleotide exchange factor GrpE [Planctomycetales bacterium]|nr:nucleotide exchange factor GrpE [Planctomycetales bacterium]
MEHDKNSTQDEHVGMEDELQIDQTLELTDDQLDSALDGALEQAARESDAATDNASVDERVQEAEREVLRARAELENFRKRMQRDSEQQLKYANIALMRDLLDVVDNLNRATDAAKAESKETSGLLEGVQMVTQQLTGVLAKFGCKPIASQGEEFDPNFHEAISQMPSEEYAAGVVAQEVAVGYQLHDRVVRPSSVIVSTGNGS